MVYKKYIKIGDKTYGPYYYESYRENGKVKKRYVKSPADFESILKKEDNFNALSVFGSRVNIFILLGIILLVGIMLFVFMHAGTTGRATLELQTSYQYGEPLKGSFLLTLQQGELLPKDSIIGINIGDKISEYPLSQLVNENTSSGDFYVNNAAISGRGEGYGIAGNKTSFPEVDFELRVFSNTNNNAANSTGGNSNSQENQTIQNNSEQQAEPLNNSDNQQPMPAQDNSQTSTPDSAAPDSAAPDSAAPSAPLTDSDLSPSADIGLTGNVINDFSSEQTISGSAAKGNDFSYNLEQGQSAEIVPGSVKANGTSIGDSNVDVQIANGRAVVSTNYEINQEGFGESFLGNDKLKLSIDLSSLNLDVTSDIFAVSLDYGNISILSVEKNLSVSGLNQSIANETILSNATSIRLIRAIPTVRLNQNSSVDLTLSDYFSGAESYSFANADNITSSVSNDVLTLTAQDGFMGARKGKVIAYNGSESLESNDFNILVSSGNVQIITSRDKIEVGKPVMWIKNISIQEQGNVIIDLPKEAENISLKKIENNQAQSAGLTGNAILDNQNTGKKGFFSRLLGLFRLTGNAVGNNIGDSAANSSSDEIKSVNITSEQNASNYIVEYQTPAPSISEEMKSNGKIVEISGPDGLNYTDVIASTNLSNRVLIDNADTIRVYWHDYGYNVSAEIKNVGEVANQSVVDISGGEVNVPSASINNTSNESIIENNVSNGGNNINTTDNNDISVTGSSLMTGNAVNEFDNGTLNSSIGNMTFDGLNITNEGNITKNNLTYNSAIFTDSNGNRYQRKQIPFDAYDLDGDGKIDYIEWVVPHLSNQTFEIIEISKAEHLDENRSFIEDVYDAVKARDNNWTIIPAGDYLRVTFAQNLTNKKDITIYARTSCADNSTIAINGTEVPCEIYLKKLRLDALRSNLQT